MTAQRFSVRFVAQTLISCLLIFPAATLAALDISAYGFVKCDLLHENRIVGNLPEISPPLVPLDSDHADDHCQTILDARSSRIGIKIKDEFCSVKTTAVIEGDFFTLDGDARSFNGRHLRLRMAYAKAELPCGLFFLMGQYWTLLMGEPEIPMVLTANSNISPVGTPLSRQPQFRIGYKRDLHRWGTMLYEATIEKHAFNQLGIITPTGGDTAQGCEQKWPLFAAKLTWLKDNLKWNLAAAATESYDIVDLPGREVHDLVWMVISTASLKFNKLTLWGTAHYCRGLNRIFSSFLLDQLLDSNLNLTPLRTVGGTVAARWDFINNKLWSTVVYGIDHAKCSKEVITKNVRKTYQDFRVNLFYKFWDHWQFVIEYETLLAKTFDDEKGRVNAVHLALWYFFGEP